MVDGNVRVFELPGSTVKIKQYSDRGCGIVWDGALTLISTLIKSNDVLRNSMGFGRREDLKIIELGAGTGATGIVMKKLLPPASVVITDLPDSLDVI